MSDTRSSRNDQVNYGNGKNSRSASKVRRLPVPRVKSSPRLIKSISVDDDLESDVSLSISADTLDYRTHDTQYLDLNTKSHEVIQIPFAKAFLDISLPLDYLKDDVLTMIRSLKIPKWYCKGCKTTQLIKDNLKLTRITGAMTNSIFKVEYNNFPSLLLRVYGPNVDSIIDRDYELQILARLSIHNIGPSLYGCFLNGRFEQFLDNSQTLTKENIRDWKTSQRIARRMKELHVGVPLTKNERKSSPIVWTRIENWMSKIEKSGWCIDGSNIRRVLLVDSWKKFKEIVLKYRCWLNEFEPHVDLVFCHNDTQYGNLLFTSPVIPVSIPSTDAIKISSGDSGSLFSTNSNISVDHIINPSIEEQSQDCKLVVIDFEYSGPNTAAYDLANHLCEWMCDYHCFESYKSFENNYPTKEEVLNFIYCYVSHLNGNKNLSIDEEVRNLYNSIIRHRALVSLHWSLWGIIQSGEIDFPKTEEIIEKGPGGDTYIITENHDIENDDESICSFNSERNEDGVDIESFENILYANEKLMLLYSDLILLGVIDKTLLPDNITLKKVDTNYL